MLLDLLSDLYGPSGPGPEIVFPAAGDAQRQRRLMRDPAIALALDDDEFAVLLQLTGQRRPVPSR